MSIRLKHLLMSTLAGVVFAAACASGGASASSGDNASKSSAPRRDRYNITADDMKDLQVTTLYEVVQRLHPEWLTSRTSAGPSARVNAGEGDVQVYLDTQRAGGVDMLKTLQIGSAASLRFYPPNEAQSRFGNGNNGGVIQVVSRTR